MKGHAELHVFTERERQLHARAVELVSRVDYEVFGEPVRCHELARAVGRLLDLPHEDGKFGFVEHTWLWLGRLKDEEYCPPWVLPNVLDVYVPGAMPQVQLVHMATGLPTRYVLSSLADLVVKEDVVEELLKRMRAAT